MNLFEFMSDSPFVTIVIVIVVGQVVITVFEIFSK
jgi:hypothetical protein